jgi:hypothetical protein
LDDDTSFVAATEEDDNGAIPLVVAIPIGTAFTVDEVMVRPGFNDK